MILTMTQFIGRLLLHSNYSFNTEVCFSEQLFYYKLKLAKLCFQRTC